MCRLVVLAVLLIAAPAAAQEPDRALLARHAPVLVHDAREASPLRVVDGPQPIAYARKSGPWLQYWLYADDNPQDRGILRTGRHEGDWELVMVHLGSAARPDRVVASQHAGAESCPWQDVQNEAGRPRSTSPTGRTRATSGAACATACGPTPATRRAGG